MPIIPRLVLPLVVVLAGTVTLALRAAADAPDATAGENRDSRFENSNVRFSATLTPEQREQAGLTVLSADNLAVIDGLVRQDEAASKFKNNSVDHTRFSQRHTVRERELAGLNQLAPAQIAVLDDLVAARIPDTEPSLGKTVASLASGATPTPVTAVSGPKPEVHGAVSFTYGWSKAGDSIGGDVLLTYDDPVNRYGVAVGYSTYRGPVAPYGFFPGYGPYAAPHPMKH